MDTVLTQQDLDKILAEHTQYNTGFGGTRADFECAPGFHFFTTYSEAERYDD